SLTSSAANTSSTHPEAGPRSASTEPSTPTEPSPTTKRPKRISPPPIERMVTRAASGAIAPKSVDEILKEAEVCTYECTQMLLEDSDSRGEGEKTKTASI